MVKDIQLRVVPQVAASETTIKEQVVRETALDARRIQGLRVVRRSIDARQRQVFVNLTVRCWVDEPMAEEAFQRIDYPNVEGRPQVIVVGAGPGGLFAALRLIELGLRPIVVERGKDVHERKKDIARISRDHLVDPESNYSFGEGGAGAYSDGKLYTRSKKRGSVEKILNVFCQHGAQTSILADAHPHIGTDRLPRVIENIRQTILRCGGEVHFQTRMTDLLIEGNKVIGCVCSTVNSQLPTLNSQLELRGPVILATGHSARDVYRLLAARGIDIEAKGIAVGVRLEHPSELIDQIQYHSRAGRGRWLPAAEYSYVQQCGGRGVYSFCMCPGGFVVPAATGPEQVVVNGMSPSHRNGRWSNSGMVVELRPEDIRPLSNSPRGGEDFLSSGGKDDTAMRLSPPRGEDFLSFGGKDDTAMRLSPPRGERGEGPLSMLNFQEHLEHLAWQQGGRRQTAPAQRMTDFVNGRLSYDLPESSYAPGLVSSPLHFWMPPFIVERLQEGFRAFGRKSHGFLTREAILIGVETRTSAPVRILRDNDTLHHIRLEGLYPCGEGAGYAGGIVSAAIDGERCAEAVAHQGVCR
ncbi:MAG: FAD-binding protein [Bacteroidaceae bacterium]|nr:FAD-binding protein [Bacteroidaceae bacterium]